MEFYDNGNRLMQKDSPEYKQIEKNILEGKLWYNPNVKNHYSVFLNMWMRDDIWDYMTDVRPEIDRLTTNRNDKLKQ